MKIAKLMTRDVSFCTPSTTLNDAAGMMWQHDCGSLPVVAAEDDRRVIGMITDRDICMAAYHQGRNLKELNVEEAMSRALHSCRPEDELSTAQQLMSDGQVRRLPVIDDDGQLVGLLCLAHLARASEEAGRSGITAGEVGRTLAAICEPIGMNA